MLGNLKRGGITPTMVIAVPLTRMLWPIAAGERSNCSCHTRSPIITTGAAPGRLSSSRKSRPTAGAMRNSRKVLAVTRAPSYRAGTPVGPTTLADWNWKAAR